jgi:hypothetical protein
MASVAPASVKIKIVKATTTSSPAEHHGGCSLGGKTKRRRKREGEDARALLVVLYLNSWRLHNVVCERNVPNPQ